MSAANDFVIAAHNIVGQLAVANGGTGTSDRTLLDSGEGLALDWQNRSLAGIWSVTGDFTLMAAGNKLLIKEGPNAAMGTAVLVAGTVTVNTNIVTANSRIFLTIQTPGGTVGVPHVSARTDGTSFTITSTSGSDTSTIAWHIVEPAP